MMNRTGNLMDTTITYNPAQASSMSGELEWVSDEAYKVVQILLYVVVCGAFCLFGCLANLANMVVFLKQGLQDSANITLFCLSASDLGLCLFTIPTTTASAVEVAELYTVVDILAVQRHLTSVRGVFNELSICTTVYLSLERCLCVMKPLTFKHLITKQRTITILALMYTIFIVIKILWMSTMGLSWQYDVITNSTRLMLYTTFLGPSMEELHRVVSGLILPFASMTVVTGATVVMLFGLRRASQFRTKSSSCDRETTENNKSGGIPQKDIRLIKTVIYISVIFIVCYLPMLTIFIIRSVDPEVDMLGLQSNFNETFWAIIYATATLNSSANIFIYLQVSTRYKDIFMKTFCGSNVDQQVKSTLSMGKN